MATMALRPTLLSRFLNTNQLLRSPLPRKLNVPRTISTSTSNTPRPSRFSRPFARFQRTSQRFNSSSGKANANANAGANAKKAEDGSLSQRLRKLSREYGWAALGVYLTLSALDFPICFAAVRLLGPERIGHYEHVVVQYMKDTFKAVWPVAKKEGEAEEEDALPRNLEEASIWTQLALAYAIHKSVFIFVRVPLTAAVTPKVVKVLRGWGWNIGKRKPKTL